MVNLVACLLSLLKHLKWYMYFQSAISSGLHFYTVSEMAIACKDMQLRFFKVKTLLSDAFNDAFKVQFFSGLHFNTLSKMLIPLPIFTSLKHLINVFKVQFLLQSGLHFNTLSKMLIPCRDMQLRLLKVEALLSDC